MNSKSIKKYIPWKSDTQDGNYRNPVLYADYSDPDVIRVGEWFYMTSSSFQCTPGLPVLRSKDLVNWELIGHALKNVPGSRYQECQPGCGVWAPAIRYHKGVFYIVYPTPDEGLFVVTSKEPEKEWSDPWPLLEGKGVIDPCPFWDDDGKAYIIHAYAFSRAGIKSKLRLLKVSTDLKEVLDEGTLVVDAMERIPTLEGPKMFKHEGLYYISAPAGGVPMGCQMVFRSENIYGPYEEKILLEQRGSLTNGPHQGALVDDVEGSWWFIHFQDLQPWGRIVHLQPAFWKDRWPMLGGGQDKDGVGRPVETYRKPAGTGLFCRPADSDDFSGSSLGLQWQWNANHQEDWYRIGPGKLELFGAPLNEAFSLYPRILAQKINAPAFRGIVDVQFSPNEAAQEAGICIVGLQSFRLGIRLKGLQLSLEYSGDEGSVYSCEIDSAEQRLFVEMNEGGLCRFGCIRDEGPYYIGPSFRAEPGRWIGARFGIYCIDPKGNAQRAVFTKVEVNSP